jgi:hypothetical protein
MDQTAKHNSLAADAFSELFERLQNVGGAKLSFVQLRRLQDQLIRTSNVIEREVTMRAAEDASGDNRLTRQICHCVQPLGRHKARFAVSNKHVTVGGSGLAFEHNQASLLTLNPAG